MDEVGAFEAKNRLSALLERAERGEEILITRRGKPVARLGPVKPVIDRGVAREAANRILERSRSASLGGINIKELIAEGRR